jgi:hypothetical protein
MLQTLLLTVALKELPPCFRELHATSPTYCSLRVHVHVRVLHNQIFTFEDLCSYVQRTVRVQLDRYALSSNLITTCMCT